MKHKYLIQYNNIILIMCLHIFFCASEESVFKPGLPEKNHGLNYTEPAVKWDEALPLGNGNLGALVWGEGHPLKISLDRKDLWDTRKVPEFYSEEYKFETMLRWHNEGKVKDLVRLYEKPYSRAEAPTKIPAGRIELYIDEKYSFTEASLSLADAAAETQFSDNFDIQVFVHAEDQVGIIKAANDQSIKPKLIAPPFSAKPDLEKGDPSTASRDLALLGYPAPVETSGENWQAFSQKGLEGFHFAVYLEWTKKGSDWIAAWSISSSNEGENPLEIAKGRVEKALDSGFNANFRSHKQWWKEYWNRSSIDLPNEILERQWYLEQYKFGAASRKGYPPITLQALWTADNQQIPPWKGDYHHDLNTELSYWPCYSGNHLEEGINFVDWLWDTRENCRDWTKRFFDLPGLCVPMTADINNNQMGGWRQYTHSSTTAAWLAHHFYLHWKYSADRKFLEEKAFPYLKDVSVFLEAFTRNKGTDGLRTMPLSSSPEYYDNRPEAWFSDFTNYDLSLIRWLFGATAELADELDLNDEAVYWGIILAELPQIYLGKNSELLLTKDHPVKFSHRHFSHLMAIHPLGIIDRSQGEEGRKIINASLEQLDSLGTDWWTGYSFAWLGSLAARAEDGEKAEKALEIFSTAFTLRNSFHCNGDQSGKGYSKFRYRPFTLEGNFAAAAGIQEMLLQSHTGRIRIFPAVPANWKDISFTTLRAEGAFLVSAEKKGGIVTKIEVFSVKGGDCKIVSPFTGKNINLSMKPGETVYLDSDPE
jgi:alpha-L-fucosidase 2